jgi:hypothetical protein
MTGKEPEEHSSIDTREFVDKAYKIGLDSRYSIILEERTPSNIHGRKILFIRSLQNKFIDMAVNRKRDRFSWQQASKFAADGFQDSFRCVRNIGVRPPLLEFLLTG